MEIMDNPIEVGESTSKEELLCNVDTQTEITAERMDISEQTVAWLLEETRRLSSLVMLPFSEHFFTKDADICFYTPLPSLRRWKCVLAHVSSGMNKSGRTKLTPFQEMTVALVKLRLDLPLHDLACRMAVNISTVHFQDFIEMVYSYAHSPH